MELNDIGIIYIMVSISSKNNIGSLEMLTNEQLRFYQDNGYLLVEDVITNEQLKKLQEITYEFIDKSRMVTESNDVYDLDLSLIHI